MNWSKGENSYVLFSILVGAAGIIAGLVAGVPVNNGFLALFAISVVIGVATAWRYNEAKKLIGPAMVASVLMSAYTVLALSTENVTFGLPTASYSIMAVPALVIAYILMLFIFSVSFFLSIKKFKESSHKTYLLFSLLAGITGLLLAGGGYALGNGITRVIFAFVALVFIISTSTLIRYSSVKRLLGPALAAATVFAAFFAWMSIKTGQSLFGDVTSLENIIRLVLLELPIIIAAVAAVAFAASATIFLILRPVFSIIRSRKN